MKQKQHYKNRALAAVLLLLMTMLPQLASAHDFEVDGIYYNRNGSYATVTYRGNYAAEFNEYHGRVTIPSTVTYNGKTYSVSSIGDYAFHSCSDMKSVTIPNSVTSIGEYAFKGCSSLTSVTIPNSVTLIGERAFYSCTSLTSVTLNSNSIVSENYSSDYNISNIFGSQVKNYIIGDSVTSIGDYAFIGCSDMISVTIPNSMTSIGNWAFANCRGLTSVSIPNSMTEISIGTFAGCLSLTSVSIPNSVTSIDDYAFSRCSGLTSVTIPSWVTSFGDYVFYGCSGLTSVTWNMKNCRDYLDSPYPFDGLSGISSFNFGAEVRHIPACLCYNLTGLTSLIIPNSVTSIGQGAFEGCSGLTSIEVVNGNTKYDSRNNCNAIIETETNTLITGCNNTIIPNSVTSIGHSAFLNCKGLKKVTIPDSVKWIYPWAFYGCSGIKELTIGYSVTSISSYAFSRCSGLTNISCYAPTPPYLSDDSFSNYNVHLGVLPSSKSAYESKYPWNKFTVYALDVKATGISLNKTSTSLTVGETETLVATVTPSYAANKTVSWKSSNKYVVTVDQTGKVTAMAVGTGTVNITATTTDGTNLSATCQVTLTPATVLATGISLNKTSTSLTVGATETLVATVTPSNATNKTVSWKSSNTSIATVDQNGKVTAKAVGSANITATTTDGTNLTATCQLTVNQVETEENTITIGDGTVKDESVPICNWYMDTFTGSECLYVKDQLADLKAGDIITSIGFYLMKGSAKGGNFNVRMKNTSISSLISNANNSHDTSSIEVNYSDQVNGNVTLGPYSSGQWIYFPLSTPFVYNGKNIIIDIRNTTPGEQSGFCYFATTTYNGVRRSLVWHNACSENTHADGFSSDGGIFGYENSSNLPNIKITYFTPVYYATGISLNKTSTSLNVGATETLVATVTPSNATNKTVSWKSSNTSVATVDQTGKVTAKAVGTANMTATTTDGTNLSATCKVTVTPATVLATGISLNKTSTSLTVGATETLVATVTPSNTTNKTVSWKSSNTSVATVDQTGKVTAKAVGTANITATTTDGTNLSATCKVTVTSQGDSEPCPSALVFSLIEQSQPSNNVGVELKLVNSSQNLNGFNMLVKKDEGSEDIQWKQVNRKYFSANGYGHVILARLEDVNDDEREELLNEMCDIKSSVKQDQLVIVEILTTNDCRFFPVLNTPTGIGKFYLDMSSCQDGVYKIYAPATATGCSFSYTGGPEGTVSWTADEPVVLELNKTGNVVTPLDASGSCPSTLMFSALETTQQASDVAIELMLENSSLNLNGFNMLVKKDEGSEDIQWKQVSRKYFSANGYGHVILARLEDANDDEREELLNEMCDIKSSVKQDQLVIIEILTTNDCRFFPVLDAPTAIGNFHLDMSACGNGVYKIYAPATATGCSFSYTGGPEGTTSWTADAPVEIQLNKQGNTVTAPVLGISVVGVDKNVTGIKYYNMQGHESDTPFPGINIMVTTYSDGTKTAKKILCKQ